MDYDQMREYLKASAGSKYGIDTTKRILDKLDNPQDKIKCVHIAGTNGKGSTTAMLCSILRSEGYKVGMYTSPALEEFEEVIQINNAGITKAELSSVVEKVKEAAQRVIAEGFDSPSEFEILTCAMYLYFHQQKVDIALVEVGLGGELDATNVITPVLSIITSISYDHMNILGKSLADIAKAKCGIIKPTVPVVTIEQPDEAAEVIKAVCNEKQSYIVITSKSAVKLKEVRDYKQYIEVTTKNDYYEIGLSLLGLHQLINLGLVVNAVELLQQNGFTISRNSILSGLSSVIWKGRLEVLKREPLIVIDGAHNADGFSYLKKNIKTYFKYDKLYLIIGILADKEVETMVSSVAPIAEKIFTVTPKSPRAEKAENLRKIIHTINSNCEAFDDYETAYKRALELCGKTDMILGCGSLYMIGNLRKIIGNN